MNFFIANWFKGCFIEQDQSTRDLNGHYYMNSLTNTIEDCIQFCRTNSYTYAGVQNEFVTLTKNLNIKH